jgi:hypothetical protein
LLSTQLFVIVFIRAVKWNKNECIFSRSSTNLSKILRSIWIFKPSSRKSVNVHIGYSRFILIHLIGLSHVLDFFYGGSIETDWVDGHHKDSEESADVIIVVHS